MKTPKPATLDAEAFVREIGDPDLALFFLAWLKHGMDATAAYKELHPNVTHGSAEVLGSRALGKVRRDAIMSVYKLGHERYFKQLSAGLDAKKWNDFTGEREDDHATRRPYHDKLGRILGIEQGNQPPQFQSGGDMTVQFIKGDVPTNTPPDTI